MMEIVLAYVVGTLFSAVCLWAGMKITKVQGTFLAVLVIAAVSSLFGIIPSVGWLISMIVMFALICKWTDAEFWPDAVLVVIVASWVAGIFGRLFLAWLAGSL